MNAEQYKKFQEAQNILFNAADSIEPIETVKGNELFQRISDACFEFYQKHHETSSLDHIGSNLKKFTSS